jgi:hypothetical protein
LVKAVESFSSSLQRVQSQGAGQSGAAGAHGIAARREDAGGGGSGLFVSGGDVAARYQHQQRHAALLALHPDTPTGVAYGETLADIFYDAAPVKEFRKRYRLEKLPGAKYLLQAILKAYKEWGGKNKKPNIAILEFRQPFQTTESGESAIIAEMFRREGLAVEVVSPEQLEYRDNVLRRGDFAIDLIFRRVKVQEFLVRFDLSHPLLRAYRDRRCAW